MWSAGALRRTHSHLLPLGGPGTQGPYPQCSRGKVWANGARKRTLSLQGSKFCLEIEKHRHIKQTFIMNHEAFVSLNRQRLHSQEETECCQEACFCKKLPTMSGPKMKDTPRSFSAQPEISYQTVSTLTYPRPEDCVGIDSVISCGLVRICPKKVTDEASVRDISRASDTFHLPVFRCWEQEGVLRHHVVLHGHFTRYLS